MAEIHVSTRFPDGTSPHSLRVEFILSEGSKPLRFRVNGSAFTVATERLQYLQIVPDAGGYWKYCTFNVEHDLEVEFAPLPATGPLGWWHQVHGVADANLSRASGVRIGIIDEALAPQGPQSCIGHVLNLGHRAATGVHSSRSDTPRVDHGRAVTSLVGSRCNSTGGFQGIAPGAEIVFAAAGVQDSERLSPAYVTNAIECLVREYRCDFINVSAGDIPEPLPEVESVLRDAWDSGVLCFFASGNQGPQKEVLYPARYSECLSVAALGLRGSAPPETEEMLHDRLSDTEIVENIYWWRHSSVVGLADVLAAGSNVIWTADHRASGAVNGTSFACPIAVGTTASLCSSDPGYLAMPRNHRRSEYALSLLQSHSIPVPPLPDASGRPAGVKYGIIRI